ncbi:MAG TPA: porin [Ramlibacter sp.]|nr:porin [Ramlibacter sp.]
MMKTRNYLVATGAALCCGLGWAQSTVQIYGVVDLGLAYANKVRSGAVGSPTGNTLRIDSGNASTSRLGFRGREDLGGGLSAVFVLEQGINADSGTLTSGGRAFGRASYVGLAGGFGEVQLGRQVTTIYDFATVFDPVAPARFGSPIFDAAYVGRADNAVKYQGKFGGLNVRAQYSLGFDGTIVNGGEVPGEFRVGKQGGVFADYTVGGLNVGAAFDRQNGTSVATQRDKNEHVVLGAAYDFQPVKVFAAYARQTVETGGVEAVSKLYWVGARVKPSERVTLTAAVYVHDPAGGSNRSVMPTVAGYYDLSKRTDLYAQVGTMKNQSAATRGMIGAVNPGDSQVGLTLGLRHRF